MKTEQLITIDSTELVTATGGVCRDGGCIPPFPRPGNPSPIPRPRPLPGGPVVDPAPGRDLVGA